jgi:hypothetical protein
MATSSAAKAVWIGCLGLPLLVGCATLWTQQLSLPEQNTVVRGQLVFHSDFPLPANHRLLEELTARRSDLEERLGLPGSDEPIHVYLFDSAEQFKEFVRSRHPDFPPRRAFFIETDTRLQIYAQWGDRLAEDLRHEVTHGYLHSVVSDVPLWLDEGLAEYSEPPRAQHGLNRDHLKYISQQIRQGLWQPDLARLERLAPSRDLSQPDYAESWAWVHFLLETRPERAAVLRDYLAARRQKGVAEPLSTRLARLDPDPAQALVAHVTELSRGAGESYNPR